MTALGFLYPGHSAEDDYPRIEQLLGSNIRLDVIHTDVGEDSRRIDALRETGHPDRLAAGMEKLRMAGAEAVVWAGTSGGFVDGWDGAHAQVRSLALAAGMPASSTPFAFVHAAAELGVRRVTVGATYPDDVAELFADFLRAGGLEVTGLRAAGAGSSAEVAAWGETELSELAGRAVAEGGGAEAVLLPDTALHTAAYVAGLEKELGVPVLAANQVSVWEALRLTERRVNAPALGALFTREPLIQA